MHKRGDCVNTKDCELCFICDFKVSIFDYLPLDVDLYSLEVDNVLNSLILQLKNIFAYCIYATKDSIVIYI